jgi:hypothetical protein
MPVAIVSGGVFQAFRRFDAMAIPFELLEASMCFDVLSRMPLFEGFIIKFRDCDNCYVIHTKRMSNCSNSLS